MNRKQYSIAVSKLARYASDPKAVFDSVDAAAVKYGNRAHNALGARPRTLPSSIKFVILAAAIVAASFYLGLI